MFSQSPEVEQARREFLDECDFVIKIPAVCYLKGNEWTSKAIVHPIPLYSYYGIKLNEGNFCIENRRIKNDFSVKFGNLEAKDIMEDKELEEETDAYFYLLEKAEKMLVDKFKINKRILSGIKKSKFKIWSGIPKNYFIQDDYFFLALGVFIYCLDHKIDPNQFNDSKKGFKTISKMLNPSGILLSLEEIKEKGINPQKYEAIYDIFKISWLLNPSHNGVHFLSSLIGISEEERKESSIGGEGLFYSLPLPKEIKREEELVTFFLIPDEHKENETLVIDYINEILGKNQIRTDIIPNLTKDQHILITSWTGEEKGLFGAVLSPFFLAGFPSLKTTRVVVCNNEFEDDMGCLDIIAYRENALRLIGSSSEVLKAGREIEDSGKGKINYYSYTLDYEVEGARLLLPKEYKLSKRPKIVKANLKAEPKEEKLEYAIFLSRPSGIRTIKKEDTEEGVQAKYMKKKENYDIFVYEQAVYKKVMDGKKAKMISLNPSISFRGLLILFLKYKDVSLPYVELYHRAFSWRAVSGETNVYHDRDAKLPTDVMNTLKNSVNELKREFDNIKGFDIPRAKNSTYKCEGNFKFCLILKKATNEHYTMLFEKFKPQSHS